VAVVLLESSALGQTAFQKKFNGWSAQDLQEEVMYWNIYIMHSVFALVIFHFSVPVVRKI
jgi:hypothetical protein